jgi:hypothetical protein
VTNITNLSHRSGFKSFVETATSVAVLLTCVGFLGALSWGYFVQRRVGSLEGGLHRGKLLSTPGIDLNKADQTLLIGLSTKCHFCVESTPLYNEVVELGHTGNLRTAIVAVFPENKTAVELYVKNNNLNHKIETIAGYDLALIEARGTPTAILLDSQGKILDFWIGKLQPEAQEQLIQAIQQPRSQQF